MESLKRRISFITTKKVTSPVKVNFRTKAGERVTFASTKKVTKPVRIEFYHMEKTHEGKAE